MKVLSIILIITAFALVIAILCYKKMKKKYDQLKTENEQQKKQIDELLEYSSRVNENKQEKDKVQEKIREAKTDEDIRSIVGDIVAGNNDRVQKSTTRKGGASAKTGKAGAKET